MALWQLSSPAIVPVLEPLNVGIRLLRSLHRPTTSAWTRAADTVPPLIEANATSDDMASPRPTMWYCHECQREMQPLMVPDPTCSVCRGTFVEQLEPDADTNPDHDPRHWAQDGDDGWVDEGSPLNFAQLFGHILGGAGGGGPGAVPDDRYDGENPFAEGATDYQGMRSERNGGGEPGVDPAGPRHPQRTNSGPVDFLQALFGNPEGQAGRQDGRDDAAGPSGQAQDQPGVRTWTRTFGGNDGSGRAGAVTFSFGTTTTTGPGHQPPRPQRAQTEPGAPTGQEEEDGRVPIRSLASFLHQAFGAPPPLERQQPRRTPSDPSADRPPPNRDENMGLGPDREQMPLDYLRTILEVLNGGLGGGTAQMGDFAFSETGFQDILNQLMQQAEGRYGPQPASDTKIESLQRVTMTKEMLAAPTVTDCAVCKDEFAEGDECIALPCKHLFHAEDCLLPWLKVNGSCPVCRYSLVDDPTDDPADVPADPSSPPPTSPPRAVRQSSTAFSPPIEGSILPGAFPSFEAHLRGESAEAGLSHDPPRATSADPLGASDEPLETKSTRELAAEAAERRQAGGPSTSTEKAPETETDDLDLD